MAYQHVREVSPRLRFAVLHRDNYTCQYCGATAPDAALEVDHIIPLGQGGTNDPENLVTACLACNRGKGDVVCESDGTLTRNYGAELARRIDATGLPLAVKLHTFDEAGNAVTIWKQRAFMEADDYTLVVGELDQQISKLLRKARAFIYEAKYRYGKNVFSSYADDDTLI